MKFNWRTTLGGILLALGQAGEAIPIPYATVIGPILSAIGAAILSWNAVDKQTIRNGTIILPPKSN